MGRLALGLLLLALTACAGRRYDWPRSGNPPAGRSPAPGGRPAPGLPPARAEAPSEASCANAQYAFQCAVPEGYLLTQERKGPGTIMVFVKRARGSEEEANLALRVTPLAKGTLESFVERRIARDLKKAQGVANWKKEPAVLGGRSGVEINVERQYASGPYRSRIFCFQEGSNVFILDHTVPAHRYDREKAAFEAFLEGLTF